MKNITFLCFFMTGIAITIFLSVITLKYAVHEESYITSLMLIIMLNTLCIKGYEAMIKRSRIQARMKKKLNNENSDSKEN